MAAYFSTVAFSESATLRISQFEYVFAKPHLLEPVDLGQGIAGEQSS